MSMPSPEVINERIRTLSGYIGKTCRYGLCSCPEKKTGLIVGLEVRTCIGVNRPEYIFKMENGDVANVDQCYTFQSFLLPVA